MLASFIGRLTVNLATDMTFKDYIYYKLGALVVKMVPNLQDFID